MKEGTFNSFKLLINNMRQNYIFLVKKTQITYTHTHWWVEHISKKSHTTHTHSSENMLIQKLYLIQIHFCILIQKYFATRTMFYKKVKKYGYFKKIFHINSSLNFFYNFYMKKKSFFGSVCGEYIETGQHLDIT